MTSCQKFSKLKKKRKLIYSYLIPDIIIIIKILLFINK
jgi:hypothetical protein